jgi:hypothetical protein
VASMAEERNRTVAMLSTTGSRIGRAPLTHGPEPSHAPY